ncbi:MAG: Rrf2 family transcriptional regulator, partial [Gammaproteobacteria bacterium]|nr:Rrf2 family transcriptional regulator [Gammaproteobacteria bacterium]
MQLTLHTDYALRVLIYLRLKGDSLVTISEIADFYQISRNHLVKVVHHLANHGFIHTTRGKHGGMRLARS